MKTSTTARGLWILSLMLITGGLLLSGCQVITGSVTSQQIDASDFTHVEINDAFAVQIRQGDEYRVTVEISQGLLRDLEVDVRGDTLTIGLKPRVGFFLWNIGSVQRAEIIMPTLTDVTARDASHIEVNGFRSDAEARFEIADASSLTGEIDTGDTHFTVSDASRVNLEGSRGDVDIEADDASKITLVGEGQNATIRAASASRVNLSDFAVQSANVEASDASNVTVHVSGTLDAEARDASHINYYGDPTLGDIRSRDGSSITARD